MFITRQPEERVENYKRLLSIVGSLSNLYSASTKPFLHYRAAENIFCKAFDANNESRGDVSVDAVKDKLGVGIKTFIYKDSQYEKIAEFNKLLPEYRELNATDTVKKIAEARNERINTTSRLYGLEENIYHCIARKNGEFVLYEVDMPLIGVESIRGISDDGKKIEFSDGTNDYKFYRSKSTLFKKFIPPDEKIAFKVSILDDPYDALAGLLIAEKQETIELTTPKSDDREYVILPLYSTKNGKDYVPQKSGLNQWNAAGRQRDYNEIYIPVPRWIHQAHPNILPPRDQSFELILPDKNKMSAKICQDNSKALMSNPNKALGDWLLRKVLNLKEGELLTYEKLLTIGVDSVAIYKNSDGTFEIEFKQVGTYEKFRDNVDIDS